MPRNRKKVAVAMSGGVDSSLAAALLRKQGHDVLGITMNQMAGDAASVGDAAVRDARRAAEALGIAHHAVDARHAFKEKVVDYFVAEYRAGRTPNPCVECNRRIKFGYLLDTARKFGCDYLATGHYARIDNGTLRRGLDPDKDQSYFLYVLYGCEIDRILFPLGTMHKNETRQLATDRGLPTAGRSESQDICFIPDNDYVRFVESAIPPREGPIVDAGGTKVGTHAGIHRYTIGQRKGLGALGERMFVKEIRPETNTVVVAPDNELMRRRVTLRGFVSGPFDIIPGDTFDTQIRYRTPPSPARMVSRDGDRVELEFVEPVRAIAPGQAAVLYRGDALAGGGTIARDKR
ncbi:MAG: tRNA 2-thiouridine(34) synthase MnmA [Chitinivibrionales bacterium]|nr:tRNA 2-thiouridine(34) synthase MnmA [Chitinivibrionales bacterium]MBD3395429.1 tRNA 2-thiouridine(34) synthase MnmA [Chitinivibrionales bacterium]